MSKTCAATDKSTGEVNCHCHVEDDAGRQTPLAVLVAVGEVTVNGAVEVTPPSVAATVTAPVGTEGTVVDAENLPARLVVMFAANWPAKVIVPLRRAGKPDPATVTLLAAGPEPGEAETVAAEAVEAAPAAVVSSAAAVIATQPVARTRVSRRLESSGIAFLSGPSPCTRCRRGRRA